MFKNYFVIAFRNLQRNAVYSFINIAGLSVGLACSILILLWVADEVSFDRFHANHDRLFLVHANQELNGEIETSSRTPYPLMDALLAKSSLIKRTSLVNYGEGFLLTAGENRITKIGVVATSGFLNMFTFPVLHGSAEKALVDPRSIVLTRSTAKALFGEENVLNRFVKIENSDELKVTAVVEDVPSSSSIQFEFLLPVAYYKTTQGWFERAMGDWRNHSFWVFAELQDNASVEEVNKQIESLVRDNNAAAKKESLFLHAVTDWHLYSTFENGKASGGLIENVRMFTAIAVFILLIACINFMNLATARSESRAREVGIRKTVGSRRKQLIFQFLGESMLITVIAFLFALIIVQSILPFYNGIVSKSLAIDFTDLTVWLCAIGIIAVTGFLAGSYPAFYLSGFQAIRVLKGKFYSGRGSVTPRKVLVTTQFAFSILLIIGTVVVYQQINHVKSRHVGYDKKNLLLIWSTSEREKSFSSLKQSLLASGVVESVTKSSAPITRIFSSTDDVTWPGKLGDDKVSFTTIATEYDFAQTMGVGLIEGRDFSPQFLSDTSAIVINQAALELTGMKDPIGQKINIWGDDRTIIGVMENIVMGSPYHSVGPLAMVLIPGWSSTISVRIKPTNDPGQAVASIESIFKKFDPEHPLYHRFADAEFETKFKSITLIGTLASGFSALAIIISCLGLFGLAAFTAEQRTKEVGIRKILGASVSSLVLLMSKDFSKLVVFAFFVAAPLGWWLVNSFLEQYPYRVETNPIVFFIAGILTLALTLVIVSTQAIRAATSNPASALRSE